MKTEYIQIKVNDFNRYVPFLHVISPIKNPMWINSFFAKELTTLGFDVVKVDPLDPPVDSGEEQPTEPVVPPVEETEPPVEGEPEVPTGDEPVQAARAFAMNTPEEVPVEEVAEDEVVIDQEYIDGLTTINDAKETLDILGVNYDGVTKLRDLKQLATDSL